MFIPYRLKACPFCGSPAEVQQFSDDSLPPNYICTVICSGCSAGVFRDCSTSDDALCLALDAWNSRVKELPEDRTV